MYLIKTKNIFSTKIIMDSISKVYSEHYITLLGPTFIALNSTSGLHYILNSVLKEHATRVVYKHKVGKSTRYINIL